MNLLAHVIALTYGQVFPFEANCKGCGRLDANIDLYDLDVCYIHDTSIVMKKIHLDSYEDEDITVTLCPPRISNEENFFNAYNKISLNKSMIVGAINGDTLVDESELDDMVTYLNSDDAKKFDDYYNFINSTFGIKLNNIPFKCQNKQCLHKNQIQHTDFTLENFILRILQ